MTSSGGVGGDVSRPHKNAPGVRGVSSAWWWCAGQRVRFSYPPTHRVGRRDQRIIMVVKVAVRSAIVVSV